MWLAGIFQRWTQCWELCKTNPGNNQPDCPHSKIYEVFKVALREKGEDAALQAVAIMKQGQEVDLNSNLAIQAAKISFDLKIPMADVIILTTARAYQAIVWTKMMTFPELAA